jgi:hypothetical protein
VLREQGQRRFNGVTGSGHHELEEDNDTMVPGMAWVISITGSGTAWGAQCHGLEEDDVVVGSGMASWAWGQGLCG